MPYFKNYFANCLRLDFNSRRCFAVVLGYADQPEFLYRFH